MNEFEELQGKVIQWAEERRIIPNSSPLAQAIKTTEEVAELLSALSAGDRDGVRDAYGDILVTLIIGAELADVGLMSCLREAYEEIKNRKGRLLPNGIFVKEGE